MHSIIINNKDGVNHFPENFMALSEMDGNKYFYYDKSQSALKIAYIWDEIFKEDNLGDDFKDIFKGKRVCKCLHQCVCKQPTVNKFVKNTIIKLLKFVEPFEFAIWHNEDGQEFEYFKFDGTKFSCVCGSIEDLERFHPDYDEDIDKYADEANEDLFHPFWVLLENGELIWNNSREELLNHEQFNYESGDLWCFKFLDKWTKQPTEFIDPEYFLDGMNDCIEGKVQYIQSYVYDLNGKELAAYNKPKKSVSEVFGGIDSNMTWNLDGKSITIDFNNGFMVQTGEINSNFDSMQGTFENNLGLKGEWSGKFEKALQSEIVSEREVVITDKEIETNTKPKKKELKNTIWKTVRSDGSEQQITFLDSGYFEYRKIDE